MSSKTFQPGFVFAGRYTVRDAIADGGMARIYRAWDDVTKQDVAIKRLYPYFIGNEIVRKRFISEGKIQQILDHPNIVNVFEIVEKPMLAIVMEFVEGETLDEYLASKGSLNEAEVLDILLPILSAIGFAHKRGIIHRDIKPSNILLSKNPGGRELKIMDFGVAKIKGKGTSLTATGTTVGTLHYMSPEQIVGSKNIDGRADIYSLGVTLYKLVTGEVPFNAPTEFALMMAQVEATPLPPSKLNPNMSKDLEKIILKAMAKKADHRFQTIREFTHALLQSNFSTAENNETITDRVSLEVLKFAMDADQVGQDRTAEMGWSSTEFPAAMHVDTQEQTQKIRQPSEPEPTVEITSAQLLSLSTSDLVAFEDIEQTIEYQKLDPDSIADTVALQAHVNLKSRAKIVFDQAESQDFTAPKISQKIYDQAIREAAEEPTTLEKPKFRNKNPEFFPKKTARLPDANWQESHSFPKIQPNPSTEKPSSGFNSFGGQNADNLGSSSYPQQSNNYPQQHRDPSGLNNHKSNSYPQQQREPSGLNNLKSNNYPQQQREPSGLNNLKSNSYPQQQREPSGLNNLKSNNYPKQESSGFNSYGADNSLPPNYKSPASQLPPAGPTSSMAGKPFLAPKIAPPPRIFEPKLKPEGLETKMVFMVFAAFGVVIVALTFLIFSIFF